MGPFKTQSTAPLRASQSSRAPITRNTAISSHASHPSPLRRRSSLQTRYMNMLLDMDSIPRLHNILASFFTWILLAGFVIFPGTFTSIQQLDSDPTVQSSQTAQTILQSVKNLPLLVIAGICCGIGAGGMCWFWWTWRMNYVWLLNKIFLCVLLFFATSSDFLTQLTFSYPFSIQINMQS